MSRKTVTIKDVAAEAKVSRATAARALNNYGYVGGDVSERVREAAQRLGYRHNRVAQALRRGELPLIGFIPGDVQNPFFAQIAHDLDRSLRPRGHNLLIASSEEDLDQEREVVENLRSLSVRGFIVAPTSVQDTRHFQQLAAEGTPIVMIDRHTDTVACDSIVVGNRGGAREAVNYLVANGHRRIAFLGDEARIFTARERLTGYRQALHENGIESDERLIAVSPSTTKHAVETAIRLFRQTPSPTALFTVDSLMTTGALIALRSMGLSVPRDVSLVGFDDFDFATFTDPQITVVAQPIDRIGPLAAQILLQRIEGDQSEPHDHVFPTKLIIRGSVSAV
ncbi:LacI family DNA-binding transcriptional regulator [Sulfitobacter sp. 915]|uniref:LacI family DNA-binding transcriptional regulator n=1 Tax=Sulfitobacter sp. 915 TaxID=3368558 RepID=UPI0037457806